MTQEFIDGDIETCLKPSYIQLVIVVVFWQGKVLLIHRQSEPFNGHYSVPGGHVEDGETYEQAAIRELKEETNIASDTLSPMQIFIDHKNHLECHGFRFNSVDEQFSNPDDEEQEVIGWRELDAAVKLPLTPGLRELFTQLS